MGRLPFDQIDVLVVGELGKNYSGAGMDPNVIGRLMVETQPDFDRPVVTRLAVLDVSEESHGNIVGVGFADLTTERLVAKIDPVPFRINVLTSCCLERARIPITLPTDRDVFEAALETCWRIDPTEARLVVIPNTLELNTLWVSPAARGRGPRPPAPGPRDRVSGRSRSRPTAGSTRSRSSPRASAADARRGRTPGIDPPRSAGRDSSSRRVRRPVNARRSGPGRARAPRARAGAGVSMIFR